MKTLLKRVASGVLWCRGKAAGRPSQYVFILGHMRSGSTLLNHILISHPDILGAGERNAYYRTAEDLAVLAIRTALARKQFLNTPRFVVDQINHNKFLPNQSLLNDRRVRTIFLIREPLRSVTSMVRVLGPLYGTTLDDAVTHYVERLSGLSQQARALADTRHNAFLTYDDLVRNTGPALTGLANFLDLRSALSERYDKFDFTGKKGDPGTRIQLGRISPELPSRTLDIPSGDRTRIHTAYEDCLRVLEGYSWRATATDGPDTARPPGRTSRDRNEPSRPPEAFV